MADGRPDVAALLEAYADKARDDLGDSLLKRKPSGAREPGKVSPDAESSRP